MAWDMWTYQRKQMAKVIKESGISCAIYDLHRMFLTVAESLDISAYAVKRLAHHKMSDDITAGYILADVERLRQPIQKITDYLLKVRWSRKGKGKSGGLRVIYYNTLEDGTIWLLLIYAKNKNENIPAHLLKAIKEKILCP